MKIGVLGGSFDPIHYGHLHIADAALKAQAVDQIWFVPSFAHPYQHKKFTLDFKSRLLLIKLALRGHKNYLACDYEKNLPSPGYTSQLMKFLFHKFPENEFYFLIGSDIVPEIDQWHDFEWLKKNLNFLIFNRIYYQNHHPVIEQLSSCQLINNIPIDISSSQIRFNIINNLPLHSLVPSNLIPLLKTFYNK
jgi:nicotinate-nucleotide adenylyltransferase